MELFQDPFILDEAMPASSASASSSDDSLSSMDDSTSIAQDSSGDTGEPIPGGILAEADPAFKYTKVDESAKGDTCLWYNDQECTRPRSCRDCLNVRVDEDSKCMVDPDGACVTEESVDYTQEVKSARYQYSEDNYYRTRLFKYCDADDAICEDWKRRWSSASSRDGSNEYYVDNDGQWREGENTLNVGFDSDIPPYVVGEDGECVCIRACEVDDWKETVIEMQCKEESSSHVNSTTITVAVAGAVALFLMIGYIVSCYRLCKSSRSTDNSAHISHETAPEPNAQCEQTTPSVSKGEIAPPLNLQGWNSYRDQLVHDEQDRMRYGQASAPPISDMYSPNVVVEEGAGHRLTAQSEVN